MIALHALLIACLAVAAHGGLTPLIVGGRPAPIGAYPYLVSLRYYGSHICGGSIISDRHILTAARCILGVPDPKDFTVHTGTNFLNQNGDAYNVKNFIYHKDFDFNRFQNDIGLLLLSMPISFRKNVHPVALAPPNAPFEGELCKLAGWGSTLLGDPASNELQEVDLEVYTQYMCQRYHPKVVSSHICTFAVTGRGICHGDFGGPLTVGSIQVGIVSFGQLCAVGKPDVFTRVSSFRGWIAQAQKEPV